MIAHHNHLARRASLLVLAGSLVFGSAALTGLSSLVSSAPAGATGSPPWEPDPDSVGGLSFFNAAGTQIFGGNVTGQPIAAYVEGSTTVRSGDTVAALYGYLPISGQPTSEWSGEQMSASTTFPNPSAPSPLKTSTLPVVSGTNQDESLLTLEADYPNHGTGAYAGTYQLRVYTNAPHKSQTTTYDSADILITGSGSSATWSVIYPAAPPTITTTSLPKGTVGKAYTATLTASGGTGSYVWSLASGSPALPKKLTLSSAGVISGKPKTAGTTKIKVEVTSGTQTATATLKLKIVA